MIRSRQFSGRAAYALLLSLCLLPFQSQAEGLVINEFLAGNNTPYVDENGDTSDWIEIYNDSSNNVSLLDLYLTDDSGDLTKWRFPDVVLEAGKFLVVFASNKDRRVAGQELHTNFRLSTSGEYLALVDGDGFTVIHAYSPSFPEQLSNISYGISTNASHELRYFSIPTPGQINFGDYLGIVEDTKFSVDRGFYDAPFEVAITTLTSTATIRYTLDCSLPSEVSGTIYTGPILVDKTTIIRAVAYQTGYRTTDVDTQSYIFHVDAMTQPQFPENFPTTWGGGPADYAMDQSVVNNPLYIPLTNALKSLPTLSIVTEKPNLFDPSYGIYVNGGGQGVAWERPTSAEWFDTDGKEVFNINCGLRIQGGAGRGYKKHSFRLLFKNLYGPGKLKADIFPGPRAAKIFDTFIIRAGWNDAYSGGTQLYFLDECTRRSQVDMGVPGSHGQHIHLYVDGLYWGLYNAAEKPDQAFGETYFGGSKDSYDVMAIGEAIEGTAAPWNELMNLCQTGTMTNERYQLIQGNNPDGTRNFDYPDYLDVDNYIDGMMCRQWMGDWDWPHNNWHGIRNRDDEITGGFKFVAWDAEGWGMGNDRINPNNMNSGSGVPYFRMAPNAEFRLRYADHVYRHFFNGGALSTNQMIPRFIELANIVEPAIMAESARWGNGHTLAQWQAQRDSFISQIKTRSDVVLQQCKTHGMYPEIDPPVFNQRGGIITNGFVLSMTSDEEVYYTLDNSDPREFGSGDPLGTLYSAAFPLTYSVIVKSRARTTNGVWSALNEALFVVTPAAALRVTEVMYNPREGVYPSGTNSIYSSDDFEFIEFHNDAGYKIGLAGMKLTDGVDFDFSSGSVLTLEANESLLVVANLEAFTNRYPQPNLLIAGQYTGALNNGGEQINVTDGLDNVALAFTYNDSRGWPLAADGAGHSLVPLLLAGQETGALDYGRNWRASAYRDGSPGMVDPPLPDSIVINEVVAHTDYANAARPEYDSNDAIELFNAGTTVVSFANWYLSDSGDDLKKWPIPGSDSIAAGAWAAYDEVTGFHNPITNGFGLNKAGDEVYLSYLPGTSEDRVVDSLRFKGQENGRSLGRYQDAAPWEYILSPTTNAANTTPVFDVIISEIMYHPRPTPDNPGDNSDDEYIEIQNVSGSPVPLWTSAGPWRIDGGVAYTFPSNFTLAANSTAVITPFVPTNVSDATLFQNSYGLTNNEVQILGPYSGKLSNRGERIALERPQEADLVGEKVSWVIVDEVIYFDQNPWPEAADGTGQALVRLDPQHAGNDPSNWQAGFWSSPGLPTPSFRISVPNYAETVLLGSSVPLAAELDSTVITGTVSGVAFFVDGVSLGVDAAAPYEWTLGPLTNERTYIVSATLSGSFGTHAARNVAVSVSTVNNGIGASEISITGARLNGDISNNGSANVRFYWGATDGGTDTNAWEHVIDDGRKRGDFGESISGLLANGLYYYRCWATNAYGELWADSTTNFVTQGPQIALTLENSPFFESGGTATVRAHLNRLSAADVTAGLVFSGDAVFNSDYVASSNAIVIPAGQTTAAITLTGLDDPDVESVESVIVGLGTLIRGTTGTPSQVQAALISDDPQIINTPATNVTDSTAVTGGILTHGFGSSVYIYWGAGDGGTNKASWAAVKNVGVSPEGPFSTTLTGMSANQTYYFRSYAQNAGGEDWAESTLSFHTGPPSVAIDDTVATEGNAGTIDAVFTVHLSANSAIDVSVNYATADGSALAPADYASRQGTLLIPAGQPSGQILVPVQGDADDEWPSEQFVVNLDSPTNCVIDDAQAIGLIQDDDVAVTLAPWLYRVKISFPGYQCDESLEDFPALVIFNTNLINFAYGQFTSGNAAPQDALWSSLRFANSNITALLNYEVERWDTNGNSYVWVQVPALSASNAYIWAYWGEDNATNPPSFSTNGAVWSKNFKGVWHMADVDDRDSTPRGHHGTANGSVTHVNDGVIAGANAFDADADFIAVPDSDDFTLANDYTLSAWIHSDDIGNQDEGFMGTYNGSGFMFSLQNDANNTLRLWSGDWRSSDIPFLEGRWQHVVYTRKGSAGRYYVNGVNIRNRTDALPIGNGGELQLGGAGTSWGGNRFDGMIDEARIADTARSSNWVWACWLNQASNQLFSSYGEVEAADTDVPSLFIVFGATNITDTSACLTARLTSTGTAETAVWVYWGANDGGQTPENWEHTNAFGTVTTPPHIDYTYCAQSLAANTPYYYAYRASNSEGSTWSSARFSAFGGPQIENTGGATNAGVRTITLRGSLLNASPGTVTLYWGPTDAGENKLAWAANQALGTKSGNAVFSTDLSGLLFGLRYYYRCYVTNSYGEDWADATTSFLSAVPDGNALAVRNGLVLWLDASDVDADGNPNNNPANDAPVAAWRDRSGLGHDADNPDGSSPRYMSTGLNTKPVLYFGGNSYLFTTYDFDVHTEYSIFSVARYTGGDSERVIGSRSHNWLFGFYGNGDEKWHAEGWIYNGGNGNTDWHLHAGTINDDVNPAAGFWKDGNLLVENSLGSHDTVYGPGRLGFGGGQGANNEASRCEIAEVLYYDRVLNSTELDAVGSYLALKYALPTDYSGETGASGVGVRNGEASNITADSALLAGTLSASGSVFDVWLHWGDDDAGASGAWDQSTYFGSFTNVQEVLLSQPVSNLLADTPYFFSFSAHNAAGAIWNEPSSTFNTMLEPSQFNYQMQISFPGFTGSSALTNFPALLRFTPDNNFYEAFTSPYGYDLRFTSADGTRLNHEVDGAWNPLGESAVWVQIPRLTNNCSIWAYWGNARFTTRPAFTTNASTWSEGFTTVWHMNDDGAHDSSGRGHHGTRMGNAANVPGMISRAFDFDPGEYMAVPSSSDFRMNARDFSMSAWVYSHNNGGDHGIFGTWGSQFIFGAINGNIVFHANGQVFWPSVAPIALNDWSYVTITRKGFLWDVYIDGVKRDSNPQNGGNRSIDSFRELEIGSGGRDWRGWWDGLIDEPRIENAWRSSAWVAACYSNQLQGSTFAKLGPEIELVNGIVNLPASGILANEATLNALLYSIGTSYYATVYWGPSDGGTVPSAWAHTNALGTLFMNSDITNIAYHATTGISDLADNYFTWRVTNGTHSAWAQPSSHWAAEREWKGSIDDLWSTPGNWLGDNVPDVAAESALFAGVGSGDVDLNGNSYTNESIRFTGGNYTIVDNAGSASLSEDSLSHSAGNNSVDVALNVSGTAEVTGGKLALDDANNFSAGLLKLNGGEVSLSSEVTLLVNQLHAALYYPGSHNPGLYIRFENPGNALDNLVPYQTRQDVGLGNSNGPGINYNGSFATLFPGMPQFDTFVVIWTGTFTAQTTGTHDMDSYWCDEAYTMYIDLNQDGAFSASELRRECNAGGGSQGAFTLTAGEKYKVAFGFAEGGGGENVGFRINAPGIGNVNINPGSANQNGMWSDESAAAVNFASTPISVEADSSIRANSGTTVAALGSLTITNASTLTVSAGSRVGFVDTTIAADATAVGIRASATTYLTQSTGLNGSGASVNIAKTGSADLILDRAGRNLSGVTFDIQAGSLVGVHTSAFSEAGLNLNLGELLLSSPGGDIAYPNNVLVVTNSTLTAGQAGSGVVGPLTAQLNGDIQFNGVQMLTTRATDDYILRLSGQINGSGTLRLTEGTVIVDDPSFYALAMNGGTLQLYADMTLNTFDYNSGTIVLSGAASALTVTDDLILQSSLDFSNVSNLVLDASVVTINSGASLTYDKALTIASIEMRNGSSLNLGSNALDVGTLTWRNGGNLNASGPITIGTSMTVWPQRTIANPLLGAGDLYIGDPSDSWGYVQLTGTNAYAGKTQIRRAVLQAHENTGLPTNSLLVFRAEGYDQHCVLETFGTFERNIGQAPGEVFWDDTGVGGGWSAREGDLRVLLEGGATLSWNDPDLGFNNRQTLIFGSEYADSMVELRNAIDFNSDADRRIHIQNNPTLKSDFVRLSGTLSGSGAWNGAQLRFGEGRERNFRNALFEMTGTNTYTRRTVIRGGALHAFNGVGLPAASTLLFQSADAVNDEAVLLSSGTFARNIGSDNEAPGGQVSWWWGSGGFAARGGDLTVVFPNAGNPLDWGSNNRGFNGQTLQMSSQYADRKVRITNNLNIGAGGRSIVVFENVDSAGDLAELSGVLSGTNPNDWLYKNGRGTLWISGLNAMQQGIMIDLGVIRAELGVGLRTNSRLRFRSGGQSFPSGVIETRGSFNRTLGDGINQVRWDPWDRDGGFAALGGPLAVDIGGGSEIEIGSVDYLWRPRLVLGSWSADNEVNFITDLNLRNEWNFVKAYDNTNSVTDRTVMSGDLRNGYLRVYGNGQLRMTGNNDLKQLAIQDTVTVLINGSHTSSEWIWTENNHAAGLGGSGSLSVPNVEIRNLGRLAPGDGAGTLTTTVSSGNGLYMQNGSTYEWELGPGISDSVAQTGHLRLDSGWALTLSSRGGTPRANQQYDLFTYTGNFSGTSDPVSINADAIPADWVTNGVQVLHDTVGKRIYLTGLYSILSVANDPASDLTSTSATLHGVVSAQSDPLYVSVYWSMIDGGSDPALWLTNGFKADKGVFDNVISEPLVHAIGGLTTNEQWFYTFNATNAAGTIDLWGAPSLSFKTLGPPVVANTGVSDIDVGLATLNGAFQDHNRGDVVFCWGPTDGGTVSPDNWLHRENIGTQSAASFAASITGVLYPLNYVYRSFATNLYGESWSDPATGFTQTGRPGPHLPKTATPAAAHYDAGSGITLNGTRPTLWEDRSGNGRHAVENGNNNVTFSTNQVNGHPAVLFRNGSLSINSTMTSAEEYIVFRSGRYSNDPGNPNLWTPDWGGPFGHQDNYHWMFQANTRQMWGDWKPTSVSWNGDPVAEINANGNPYGLPNVADYMVLRVNPRADSIYNTTHYIGRNGAWHNSYFDIAEIIVFSSPLSALDEAKIGGYLSHKYNIDGYAPSNAPYQFEPRIDNLQATEVGLASARLNARLSCEGATYDAYVFWGTTNGGTSAGAWDLGWAFAASVTDAVETVSHLTAVPAGSTWYTFMASNALDQVWASPSTNFTTVSTPAVNNGVPSGMDTGMAVLRGNLSAGSIADITLYWGRTDGGTSTNYEYSVTLPDVQQGAFETTVNAGYGFPNYYYVCYASNEAGTAWSASSTNFNVSEPVWFINGFEETIFNGSINDAQSNIEAFRTAALSIGPSDAQGILTTRFHYGTDNEVGLRAVELGAVGFDHGDFAMLWITDFVPTESGAWGFRLVGSVDDNTSWWIDTDNNKIFEIANRWYNRGCCGASGDTFTPNLTAGTRYLLGIVMNDTGGGGWFQDFEYKSPSGLWTDINPSDISQNGLWRIGSGSPAAIENLPATNVYNTSATMLGDLEAMGYRFDVYVYYGQSNGFQNATHWDTKVFLGSFTDSTALSLPVSTLELNSDYYYTFVASNAFTNLWAVPSQLFATVDPDEDDDGLPDAWEINVLGGTNVSNGAEWQDWDGDGFNDRAEFIAGTVATNSDSYFTIEVRFTNGQITVMFEGREAVGPGYQGLHRFYDLMQSTNLILGPWQPVPGRTNVMGESNVIMHVPSPGPVRSYQGKVRLK